MADHVLCESLYRDRVICRYTRRWLCLTKSIQVESLCYILKPLLEGQAHNAIEMSEGRKHTPYTFIILRQWFFYIRHYTDGCVVQMDRPLVCSYVNHSRALVRLDRMTCHVRVQHPTA